MDGDHRLFCDRPFRGGDRHVRQARWGGVAFGAHGGGFLGGLALIYAYKLVEKRRQTEEAATDLIVDPA